MWGTCQLRRSNSVCDASLWLRWLLREEQSAVLHLKRGVCQHDHVSFDHFCHLFLHNGFIPHFICHWCSFDQHFIQKLNNLMTLKQGAKQLKHERKRLWSNWNEQQLSSWWTFFVCEKHNSLSESQDENSVWNQDNHIWKWALFHFEKLKLVATNWNQINFQKSTTRIKTFVWMDDVGDHLKLLNFGNLWTPIEQPAKKDVVAFEEMWEVILWNHIEQGEGWDNQCFLCVIANQVHISWQVNQHKLHGFPPIQLPFIAQKRASFSWKCCDYEQFIPGDQLTARVWSTVCFSLCSAMPITPCLLTKSCHLSIFSAYRRGIKRWLPKFHFSRFHERTAFSSAS